MRHSHNGETIVIRKPCTVALSNATVAGPLRTPLPQNGGPKCTRRAMSPFDNLLWPSLLDKTSAVCTIWGGRIQNYKSVRFNKILDWEVIMTPVWKIS